MRIYISLLLLCTVFFGACKNLTVLKPLDYIKWVENPENGLTKVHASVMVDFNLTYVPNEYLALRACSLNVVDTCYLDYLEDLSATNHFKLEISSRDGSDPMLLNLAEKSAYYQRMEYYNSWLRNDVNCMSGTDTLAFSFLHTERYYGISNKITILLAFDKPQTNKVLSMVYDDKIFGEGRIKFQYSIDTFNKIPQVKI